MDRPEQHDIDNQGRILFEGKLPRGIFYRPQPQDYGIDGELEIFNQNQSTGTIIKMQLKSSESLSYVNSNKEISFSLDLKHIEYWNEQLDLPVALIVADVEKKKVFWSPIQGNKSLRESYIEAKKKGQQQLTIRIPVENTIPESFSEFLGEMGKAKILLALRMSSKAKEDIYLEHLGSLDDRSVDSEMEQLKQKTELTYVEKIDRFLSNKAYSDADKILEEIYKSNTFSPYLKLHALIKKETIELRPGTNADRVSFYLWQASQMEKLKGGLDRHRQMIVEGFSLSAEMGYLVNQDYNLYVNWNMHKESYKRDKVSVDQFWLWMLPFERAKIIKRIAECLEKYQKLSIEVLDQKFYDLVSIVTIRFFYNFIPFTRRLRKEGLSDAAENYEKWIDQVITHAVYILERYKDKETADDHLGRCALLYMNLSIDSESKKDYWVKKAEGVFEKINSSKIRDKWKQAGKPLLEKIEIDIGTLEKPKWDLVKIAFIEQAKALGVRFDLLGQSLSENSPLKTDQEIAKIVAVGLEDLDPTKVLSFCSNFIFELSGSLGDIAMMLRLYTAGRKMVGCIKHPEHGMIRGMALAGCYSIFYKTHCSNCPDKSPHEPGWIFNEIWHNQKLDEWDKARNQSMDGG